MPSLRHDDMHAVSAFVHPWGCNVYIVCWCCREFTVPATKRTVRCPGCGRTRRMFHVLQEAEFRAKSDQTDPWTDAGLFVVPPPATGGN